ncbi:succinate dehydrogenase cytochrome b subunit [Nocardioides zeae]|uniref:Succinate dehydrogenase cytochrome b subunit n=1 Tax=Nocardioides imazamoxiresistens TaxID=3231893 RepID=A0ABU3PU66_9ACTN|nr:succinate dehydrogenase cytochrome b subunit [Nocardioides zeae]MDT9592760.1 succinate dehydrogenase cytochrome b subunit [Nocardioides zeae]
MATPTLVKTSRSTRSTIALKLVMAASGLLFIAFVLAHMYGNLKAFSGQEKFNDYAHHLRELGEPLLPHEGFLWITRIGLLVALVAHVTAAVILANRARRARTQRYAVKKNRASSLSSRTMRWGGVTLLLFIVWHLVNFSFGKVNVATGETGDAAGDPYSLLVDTFDVWWMTVIYLVAMLALGFHLHHGTFSAVQTLGYTNTAASRKRAKQAGWLLAIVIAGGYSLVPLAVLTGIIEK